MVSLVYCLTSLLFFDISLLYYYINLRSSMIFCLSSGHTYLFFKCIFIMLMFNCFETNLCWSFWDFHNSTSNFITNQITNCFFCFLNCSFWDSFKCICSRLFGMFKTLLALFTTPVFTYFFTNIFLILWVKDKNP